MLDGNYRIYLNTPMGKIEGKLFLKTNQDKVEGILETMGTKNQITGGKVIKENECEFSGALKTPIGEIQYNIQAILQNTMLSIMANTSKGQFKIEGEKIN